MAKRGRKPQSEKLDVIWTVTDEIWAIIEPILLEDAPPKKTGRPRTSWRRAIDGIIFRMRTGCHWNKLPREFGDDSSVHRWFQRWSENGVMERIWAALVERCEELQGVHWKWQSADGAMVKARFGGEKNRPKPDGSRQIGHEAQRVDGRGRRPVGRRDRRSQRA